MSEGVRGEGKGIIVCVKRERGEYMNVMQECFCLKYT